MTITGSPGPTVTQYIGVASTGGSSVWVPVTALAAVIAALGTGATGLAALRRKQSDAPAQPPGVTFAQELHAARLLAKDDPDKPEG